MSSSPSRRAIPPQSRGGWPPRPRARARRSRTSAAGGADGQGDHHRRLARHQPDRGLVRVVARRPRDGPLRRARNRRAAPGVRDDGRARRASHRIAAFVWAQVLLIVAAASALAAVLGLLLAMMLVAMLQHAFDPPPDHLAIPGTSLGALALATALGAVAATRSLPARSEACGWARSSGRSREAATGRDDVPLPRRDR